MGKHSQAITWECTLSTYDFETLKSQIEVLLQKQAEQCGEISLYEPDFCIFYRRILDDKIALWITIDAGIANSDMGTCNYTGPSLRLLTDASNLRKWIEEIDQLIKWNREQKLWIHIHYCQ